MTNPPYCFRSARTGCAVTVGVLLPLPPIEMLAWPVESGSVLALEVGGNGVFDFELEKLGSTTQSITCYSYDCTHSNYHCGFRNSNSSSLILCLTLWDDAEELKEPCYGPISYPVFAFGMDKNLLGI